MNSLILLVPIAWPLVTGILIGAFIPRERRALAWTALALCAAAPAFVVLGDAFYGMATYVPSDPSDPGDAPAYVFLGALLIGGPFLLVLGLFLGILGFLIGRGLFQDGAGGSKGGQRPM